MKRNRNFAAWLLVAFILMSCQEEFEPGYSSIYPVSGNWLVVFDYENGTSIAEDHLLIYNTASPNDSAWVADDNFYGARVRVLVSGTKFSITAGEDEAYGSGSVTIDGEVFNEDSIHVTFLYNDTGETVVASGHRDTGF